MPSNVNPKDIKIGPGQTVPGDSLLTIGQNGSATLVMDALKAHILDPNGAHAATAISETLIPPLVSDNVQTITQDLTGALPSEPPKLGQRFRYMDFHSIPDWGRAKLNDTSIHLRDSSLSGVSSTTLPHDAFPYFAGSGTAFTGGSDSQFVNPTSDWGLSYTPGYSFICPSNTGAYVPSDLTTSKNDVLPSWVSPMGADVFADQIWNNPSVLSDKIPLTYCPSGVGKCHAGAFTRADGAVVRSLRLMSWPDATWPPVATISGAIYPADRGVLALLHFPSHDGSTPIMTEFLSQTLLERCVAALLLGQGILGADNDGQPGGIFGLGQDANGSYDPFAFPGRASGQYDLNELYTGVSVLDGVTPLNSPWDDLDQDGVAGAQRHYWTTGNPERYPAPGQVRLGTDPNAGEAVQAWGIPVLGATSDAYDGGSIPVIAGYANLPYIGKSIIHDSNFFSYRLPYLSDYSSYSGLKYTPKPNIPGPYTHDEFEIARYFKVDRAYEPVNGQQIYSWVTSPLSSLPCAGNYPPFEKDCITWQIGRFRHSFRMDGNLASAPAGNVGALGSYVLIHFKSEKDFELMVRDGDANVEVYGISFLTDHSNVVNDYTESNKKAPYYGMSSEFYNGIREEVYLGGLASDYDLDGGTDVLSKSFTWSVPAFPIRNVVTVSGVSYFTPRDLSNDSSFKITGVDVSVDNAWKNSYFTEDDTLTVGGLSKISSSNPAFLRLNVFGSASSYPVEFPDKTLYSRHDNQDYELPFSYLGSFTDASGPASSDTLDFSFTSDVEIEGQLDDLISFSVDAKPWFYVRRPLTGDAANGMALPYSVTDGHGFALTNAEKILYHGTGFYLAGGTTPTGSFGNFVNAADTHVYDTVTHYNGYSSLFTADKDTTEDFLDETYRIADYPWPSYPKDFIEAILGSGLGPWTTGDPIPIPVQAGLWHVAGDFPTPFATSKSLLFNTLSYTQTLKQGADLGTSPSVVGCLQVAGLPPRNPPLSDWNAQPNPYTGLLRYPAIDYSSGYRPSLAVEGITQPDYSGVTGVRSYIRTFDVSFSRSTNYVDVAGQPFVAFRFYGLKLEDFRFTAPGPGTTESVSAPKIAIMVKVPGLTTWMDAGRNDGSGPSKQDVSLDGAGCLVVGPNTYNGVDPLTGMVYSQVYLNVGPEANLCEGIESVGGKFEVPVMVKVIMGEMATSEYDLVGSGPGTSSSVVRGLTKIQVVHPSSL